MFLRALLAFLILPGVVAFLLPPLLASLDPWRGERFGAGAVVLLVGCVVLLWCVRDFYVAGKGTLAPWSPPKHLVQVGLYRHVRNPMYLGVVTMLVGWAIFLASPVLAGYAAAIAVAFNMRVVGYEETWLETEFGEQWILYRSKVGRWVPRIVPWKGSG